ncbi:tripartite tricarboxylate transporter substrate binding protein [Roseomonas sp. SSH11]|uniref:Tripartite tricarboxylate transporter substrate binding protein n=1 Tax=Pararoseomonas baculiformis TaxID=2820812 RepID=A0ABS4AKR3_9PROT|nr:tripartite tricarboxylate transporter substrate binding protein [Pararoseomonas baculiformis]MBP0447612.1 tripartite tricarboxylate transporter substrate binding protein [Pararoseomonas baculiformis]
MKIATRRAMLAAALLFPAASRAALPDRPLRIVLGFPPGSGPDLVARLLADGLKDGLPAGVVVDNKPGAAGAIAAQEVARAAPDGTTLLLGEVGQLAMAPSTYARLPYDPARDFAPIAEVAAADFALVVPASIPVGSFAEYLAWAKARPSIFLGTFGAGTPGHFGAAILANSAGLKAEPVHFRSTGDAMGAVLNGNVQGMFGTVALVAPHVRDGRLKALAVTGPARSPLLPGVPGVAELNQPDLAFNAWFGLVAPAATPAAVRDALEGATLRALRSPALQNRMQEAGFRVAGNGQAAFGTLMREETARWAGVVRATGFRAIE